MTDEERQRLDQLDTAAKLFTALLMRSLPPGHPLGRLFTGMMLVYFEDESALEEMCWRVTPLIKRCCAAQESFARDMLRAVLLVHLAIKAAANGEEQSSAPMPR